ncbi:CpsB/CapC family capsule biosynthesis tyrosine phosphatase [Gracilibacillus sp. S3-1-1]|uniref:CpsB/CapC family capsule biosynthesis tyrosine phosphatase n=1 Tax=Gracilibacillus pellucidus TaxID=3095368 RepID=A0ACC6M826_9BACI|nr:CpsB/CapC family capsule biosynthesis tyrosine phosphatase [Gracilibacillus sp. S3-1-1]MDX8047119.1 CpsB/CapC family capsule biosynthesis tyrosine phosphatase [Gracilibacillus sp. S3-1-1]
MLDINPYILPINQESVANISSAIAIAKEAEQLGVRKIIATPRNVEGKQETITTLVSRLNQELSDQGVNVELIPAQTIRLYGEIEKDLTSNSILTFSDDPVYLFVELAQEHTPEYTRQLCYDLQLKGYQPIFVHPEKNLNIQQDNDLLYSLVKNGGLVQISAASLSGKEGKKVQRLAKDFVKHNLVHFIGSDSREAKSYHLTDGWKVVRKLNKWQTLQDNMNLFINRKAVRGEEPMRVKKTKILGIF